jgi:hypothetical protein
MHLHRWRLALLAACLVPAQAHGQSDAVPSSRLMLLHAAADSAYVYLSWNAVPSAVGYDIEWRQGGAPSWFSLAADSGALHAAVQDLENDVAYEFRVRSRDRSGATIAASRSVHQTPRVRTECDDAIDFACTFSGLQRFRTSMAGGPRFRCEGVTLVEADPTTSNCAFRSGNRVFGFDRFAARTFETPPVLLPPAVIRAAARRALWGDADPFSSPEQFEYDVRRLAVPDVGLVSADSAVSYIIRLAPEVSSRFTIYWPVAPLPGRYVVYHEGHGQTANTSGSDVVNWFLARGWTVATMDMPFEGGNATDARYPFDSHDALRWYEGGQGHALDLFLLPVKVVVDRLAHDSPVARPTIVLAGRSGGAWTSCVYGALDPRITVAIDISGCWPRSIVMDTTSLPNPNLLHFETMQPGLFDQVSMLELITAAGTRGSFHFHSSRDPSIRLRATDAYVQYLNAVAQRENEIAATRNRTRIHLGTQPVHGLDAAAFDDLETFLRELNLPLHEVTQSTAVVR